MTGELFHSHMVGDYQIECFNLLSLVSCSTDDCLGRPDAFHDILAPFILQFYALVRSHEDAFQSGKKNKKNII